MRALILRATGPLSSRPLLLEEREPLNPGPGQVLLDVAACGLCHTDLHVIRGELAGPKLPLVPGHQIVGRVRALGEGVAGLSAGERVGVAWLGWTCGVCESCRAGRENLCPRARFTGFQVDGGFAEQAVADAAFVHRIPEAFSDEEAAPLLCAGAIGWRAFRACAPRPGARVGLYGFGASAHLVLQVARHLGHEVFVFTRGERHRALALELGAAWAGAAGERPPAPVDAAILFAPAGGLVPLALEALAPGGTLAIAAVHLSPVPELDYRRHLFLERTVKSVSHGTREDVASLLLLASRIGLRPRVETWPLSGAAEALGRIERAEVEGAAVLRLGEGR